MADAFLRAVMAQRDREQLLNDRARMARLDDLTLPRPCAGAGCKRTIHVRHDGDELTTLCLKCRRKAPGSDSRSL